MPLLDIQSEILRVLAASRHPDSYVAGGILSGRDGSRFSKDIDLFHTGGDLTLSTYFADRETLEARGYTVRELIKPRPGFVRALATDPAGESIRIDWAEESAFRFFPVVENPLTGWELHWADAATNKALAAGGREKSRDAFDILHWHHNPLSLGALVWAAVGKDPGFSPDFLLDEIVRNARISPTDLAKLRVAGPFDPIEMAARFRGACREARQLIRALPAETVGSLFLDEAGHPIEPDPQRPETLVRIHRGSERGCWPSFPRPEDDLSP